MSKSKRNTVTMARTETNKYRHFVDVVRSDEYDNAIKRLAEERESPCGDPLFWEYEVWRLHPREAKKEVKENK